MFVMSPPEENALADVCLKIDLNNGVIELQGSENFAKTELPKLLDLLKAHEGKAPLKSKVEVKTPEDTSDAAAGEFKNIGDLLAALKPKTHNENVVACAYWWAFCVKEHGAEFKNEEVLALYTGPIRRNKPARSTHLCSDVAKQTGWIRAGGKKGFWQISDDGQKYVEDRLKNPSADK
jgi:hypothetical protein